MEPQEVSKMIFTDPSDPKIEMVITIHSQPQNPIEETSAPIFIHNEDILTIPAMPPIIEEMKSDPLKNQEPFGP